MALFYIACVFLVAQALGYQEDIPIEPKQAFENIPPEFQPKQWWLGNNNQNSNYNPYLNWYWNYLNQQQQRPTPTAAPSGGGTQQQPSLNSGNQYDGDCGCGLRPSDRIVNGSPVPPDKYCWQAQVISWVNPEKSSYALCGGSVICDQYILTAAHCVNEVTDPSTVEVYLGAYENYRDENADPNTADEIIVHYGYNTSNLANDIALIKLKEPIEYGSSICQVCLSSDNELTTGTECVVTGWGNTEEDGNTSDVLQETTLEIYDRDMCSEKYGDITGKICAYGENTDSCQGDSGGPLVNKETSSYEQIGVVSSGSGCARPDTPGLYTDVPSYRSWIDENTACNYCTGEY